MYVYSQEIVYKIATRVFFGLYSHNLHPHLMYLFI